MAQSNDLVELFRIMYKWRRSIIYVTIAAAIISAVISWFFMDDYFKSSVTFYPSNPVMTDRQVLYSTTSGEIKIDYFGSASDVDRILTLAHTSSVEDYIINNFHLIEHYGYDSLKDMSRYYTKKKFEKNYNAIETEYGAIEITIWDKVPQLAADMANHLAETIDNHNKEIILRDKKLVIETFRSQIKAKEDAIHKLKDSLQVMQKNGASAEDLMIMNAKLSNAIEELNQDQKLLEQNETAANTNFSTIHITETAFPAVRKDKPVRTLIVIGATLGAFIFMVILGVLTENFKKVKSQITNG